jgi:(p)ppGpp synthase/HD superfamily hydrolase
MRDSLDRILQQPAEVAMVKLADRITNTASPPPQWPTEKIAAYRNEAQEILGALGAASPFLAARLRARISRYR